MSSRLPGERDPFVLPGLRSACLTLIVVAGWLFGRTVFPAVSSAENGQPPAFVIDIDSDDRHLLLLLPGIGPSRADRIIEERARGGPFGGAEGLTRVSGIGPMTAEAVRPYLVCGDHP